MKMEFFLFFFSLISFSLTTCFLSLAQRNLLPLLTRIFPLHHEEKNRFPLLVIGPFTQTPVQEQQKVDMFCSSPFLVSVSFSPPFGLFQTMMMKGTVNGNVKKVFSVFSFFLTFLFFFIFLCFLFFYFFSFLFISFIFFPFYFFLLSGLLRRLGGCELKSRVC